MISIKPYGPLFRVVPHMEWTDKRGTITTVMHEDAWCAAFGGGIPTRWAQENVVVEHRNVFRGLHAHDCWKLIHVPYGRIFLGVVNPATKEGWAFDLWPSSSQILIPPDFANGHLVLSDVAVFSYFWSKPYEQCIQKSYHWKDFFIAWPKTDGEWILSERDE